MPRNRLALAAALVASAFALGSGTATFTLQSPVSGRTISPGTAVTWTIRVSVSTGDNLGLALLSCDLVQDPNNPAKFDLPPGDPNSIPTIMQAFNRPRGITNPGENGAPSGYIGVRRGTTGQKNLVQIGGGQNTFGQAGNQQGTDPNVNPGVGQSGQQLVLSGTFNAPSTPGLYRFSLANAIANVLDTLGTPPQFSQVSRATANLTGASFSFTVGPVVCRGDCNCDGRVDFNDINAFVEALTGGTPCNFQNCDLNGDGQITFEDINPLVALLGNGGGPCH